MSNPLFGVLPAGQPLITNPTSSPSETSHLYALPTTTSFSHICVFLLPGIALPNDTAAAIYLATDNGAPNPNFKFLGAIGPGKESAIFSVSAASAAASQGQTPGLVIGVSVEPASEVAPKLREAEEKKTAAAAGKPSTAVLAQRIIQNAFNFLSGFSGQVGADGVEVVPLKAFEGWWQKFESRVRADPSFLEKSQD